MSIPISKAIIEPIVTSNIQYVNGIEEFEKIHLEPNQTILCFDNNSSCFYVRECDKHGEYGAVKVYFYEDFASRMQSNDKDFYAKCKAIKLDSLKVEIAYKFFIEREKTMNVWLWLLDTKKADWEYDTVKHLKWKLKKALLIQETTT
jgi:hypothetical protein